MDSEDSYLGQYGLVKIIKGKFKGRFGYYDDDEISSSGKVKSVIYFGEMMDNTKCYYIDEDNITNKFTILDLKKEKKK